ncbi:hypothetical protein ACQP2Y_46890 (plasmid) [Actinoplanes sp. CA-051413]|uniref:hypothetical protein n=1 Tax=Actinoplanes sp. CA-051413 TaxID=3239899 RepID=UPI003D9638F8
MIFALIAVRPLRWACQPLDPQEARARSARRWRLLILIVVAAVVLALVVQGYTLGAALAAIIGVVCAASMTARYVLGAAASRAV